jgi:hypothetical protein
MEKSCNFLNQPMNKTRQEKERKEKIKMEMCWVAFNKTKLWYFCRPISNVIFCYFNSNETTVK